MSPDEFRSDKQLPFEWAKELRTNRILNIVLQVMREDHPCHLTVNLNAELDISPTKCGIELGFTRGWSAYEDRMNKLAQAKQLPVSVETDYSEPQKPT